MLKLKTDFEKMKQRKAALEEETLRKELSEKAGQGLVRHQIYHESWTTETENPSSSTTSSADSSGKKRKAVDPPEDSNQDKKVKNLQKQLQASKQKVKEYKDLLENVKQSFGISPFNGKSGVYRCTTLLAANIEINNLVQVWTLSEPPKKSFY